jgi:Ca-activated chloride channel family protein
VQTAGDRTFFLRGGVWVDSAYDGNTEPQVIPFASDAYFDLLNERPELGQALALGEEIVLVIDGAAYRVTADVAAEQQSPVEGGEPIAQVEATPAPGEGYPGATGVGVQVCGLGLLLPLAVLGGLGLSRRRKRA